MSQSAVRVWRKQQQDKKNLGKTGIIRSWTEVFVSPPKFDSITPYTVVLVELDSKELVYGQLVDFTVDQRLIGTKVAAVFRKIGDVGTEDVVEYGIKFKPIE